MLKRIVAVAAVLVVAAGSLGPVTAQGGKVAMLLPGSINDQSWNAAGYGGLQKLKEQGMETAYSENVQAADHIEAMKDYARRGFSPVIGHSGQMVFGSVGKLPSSRRRSSWSARARAGRARTWSRSISPTSSSATSRARSPRA